MLNLLRTAQPFGLRRNGATDSAGVFDSRLSRAFVALLVPALLLGLLPLGDAAVAAPPPPPCSTPARFSVTPVATTQTSGTAFSVTVTALDAAGATCTAYAGTVTLTSSDPAAILPSNYQFTTTNKGDKGVHLFSVTLQTAGSQTVTVTDTSVSSITGVSPAITVKHGAAAKLAFTSQPSGATAGSAFTTQPKVTIQDAAGNTATSATHTVLLTKASGPVDGSLSGCTSATSSGVVSFSGCTLGKAGTYTLTASSAGLTGATSSSFPVAAANSAPVAGDDAASTTEDTAVTIPASTLLSNDSDVDADALDITAVAGATKGSAALNSDDSVTFTPNADYNGSASFEYTIADGRGGSDSATVTVTVSAANDAPKATGDAASTGEDSSVTMAAATLLSNDSDVDGDSLEIASVGNATKGTAVLNEDGSVTFTPNADHNGPASFEYTIADGRGGSDSATVTVTVSAVNDAPSAADDTASTDEDTAVTVTAASLLGNDDDVDGDTLSITGVSSPSNGSVVANDDGSFTFTPATNFYGSGATFDYAVSDGNGGTDTGTVTVSVASVNDGPVLTGLPDVSFVEGGSDSSIDLDDYFTDVETSAANATFRAVVTGSIRASIDGTTHVLTITGDDGFSGDASVTVIATDEGAATSSDALAVTVTASPEPEVTTTPEPETTTTPEPEVTTTPEPETTIIPEPETTTTPEPEPTTLPDPQPEPGPAPEPQPEPEVTTTPEPEVTTTPEPEVTTTPEPEPTAQPDPAMSLTRSSVNTETISPNGDGKMDSLTVAATFSDPIDWRLTLFSSDDSEAVAVFTGSEATSMEVVWNGTGANGRLVADGDYHWRLTGGGAHSDEVSLLSGDVSVDRTAPVITNLRVTPKFNPKHRSAKVSFSVTEPSRVRVKIVRKGSRQSVLGVTLDLASAGGVTIKWDGRNRNRKMVKGTRYKVVIRAIDEASNTTINRAESIKVVR